MKLKSVLITGCSEGGIGYALVEAFQKRDFHVFATARDLSKMSELSKTPNVTLLSLDPTSTASVNAALESVRTQTEGTLDYLINNAGQTIITPTLDFDIETAKSMYDINVWGMVRVTQGFAPLLIAAEGTLVSISSISTSVITPWMGVYAGSKAAMTAITEALRLELAPFDVTVLTVNTGAVSTNGLKTGVDFKLPSESIYKSIEKEIAGRARGEDGTPRMEPAVYAEKVVNDILGGAKGQVWRGGYASIVRFVLSKMPASLSDWIFIQKTGLDIMKT
ncbi:putative hydroxybutyrate dehydrogenase [Usnea florida]